MRDFARRLMHLALAAATVVGVPATAFAHGHLTSSSPANGGRLPLAPATLRLEFSEGAELTMTSVRLLRLRGEAVALGPLAFGSTHKVVTCAVRGTMAPGTYEVQWRMAGADGHVMSGSFRFVLLEARVPASSSASAPADSITRVPQPAPFGAAASPAPAPHPPDAASAVTYVGTTGRHSSEAPAFVLARLLTYLGLLAAIGAVAFRQLVLTRVRPLDPRFRAASERRAASMGMFACGLAIVGSVGRLYGEWALLHDPSAGMEQVSLVHLLRSTHWGLSWLALVGLALALLGCFEAVRRKTPSVGWAAASGCALLLAFTPALSGHAAASEESRGLLTIASGIHVLAASAWLGTLAVMVFASVLADARLAGGGMEDVALLVRGFSPVALGSAALVATSGSIAAWTHVGSFHALTNTPYGMMLVRKLVTVAGVLAVGALNWRRMAPRLGGEGSDIALRRSASVELALACVVVAFTAALVAMPTPR